MKYLLQDSIRWGQCCILRRNFHQIDQFVVFCCFVTERLCPFQNEKGESDKVDVTFWTKSLSQEKGEKLVLPPSREQGIQVGKLTLDTSNICCSPVS